MTVWRSQLIQPCTCHQLRGRKKNYMDYLANTPGVEKTGSHGLFSNEGETFIQVLRSITISEAGNISGYVVLKGSIERSHSSKKKML